MERGEKGGDRGVPIAVKYKTKYGFKIQRMGIFEGQMDGKLMVG